MPPNDAVYELEGETLAAAHSLCQKVNNELYPILKAGGTIDDVEKFQEKNRALYEAVGQTHQAIIIQDMQEPATAYCHTPEFYFHPSDSSRIVLYCPIDYKGQHFTPAQGRLLSEQETEHISMGLWANGWSTPRRTIPPVWAYQVDMPEDALHNTQGSSAPLSKSAPKPAP